MYNLPGVNGLRLGPTTLAKIFNGTVKTWNDPAVLADNTGVVVPSLPITVVHRNDSAVVTDWFTGYLQQAAPGDRVLGRSRDWRSAAGDGMNGSLRRSGRPKVAAAVETLA